jgi:osmoprotectant transport system permease protein
MNEQLHELFANLPAYLGGHILLSITALAAALAISLPLGIVASRRPKLEESALAVAGMIQTVPSLALLALVMLLLGGKIGFRPAFLALVLYSILSILANTVIGIRGVDPALTEAAKGLGMSDRQMLWRVELPLAAPVILGGVRTATVLIVGTATLATPVGGQSLGNYIFAGLSTLNHTATMFGCLAAALLAVGLDQLIHLLEIALRWRSKLLGYVAAAGLLLVTAGGLYEPVMRWFGGGNRAVIASASFTEQYILSHALAQDLEAAGFRPERREGMGYGIQLMALQRNDVDCLVTYTGDVWTLLMKRQEFTDPESTLKEVTRFLQKDFGVVCLGKLGVENAYALTMTRKQAEAWRVTSITDLARYTREHLKRPLKVGGDIAVFQRKEWPNLKEKYKLQDKDLQTVAMDQTLMYRAVSEGQVDAIIAYTSDGRVKAFDLEPLTDPEHVFPPYDAILLMSPAAARRPGFQEALKPLLGAIKQETMQEANRCVDVEKQSPKQVAAWLLTKIRETNP